VNLLLHRKLLVHHVQGVVADGAIVNVGVGVDLVVDVAAVADGVVVTVNTVVIVVVATSGRSGLDDWFRVQHASCWLHCLLVPWFFQLFLDVQDHLTFWSQAFWLLKLWLLR